MIEDRSTPAFAARGRLWQRTLAFLAHAEDHLERELASERDALLAEVARFQAEHVEPFARLVRARGGRFDQGPSAWPALPTDVFRYAKVALLSTHSAEKVFRTSGTTSGARGEHFVFDTSLTHRAARVAGEHAFRLRELGHALVLAFSPEDHADSSLGFMLGDYTRGIEARGGTAKWFLDGDGMLDVEGLVRALDEASQTSTPTALFGTSFAFVHALDGLGGRAWTLPRGSRVMTTGGTKGRSRTIEAGELRDLLATKLGIPEAHVLSEYGMTELSSQLWGRGLIEGRAAEPERLWSPPWVRVRAVDPVTLSELPLGERGLLRFDDLANLDSCVSIQTADFGITHADGVVHLLGRDPSAVPRGCSLALEEALDTIGS